MMLNCSVFSSHIGEVGTVFADEELPHSVANIDGYGFYNDNVDNRLRYKIENGEASVYAMNDSITSGEQSPLVIPHKISNGGNVYDVTSIGECGFDDCENLISIVILNWITSIGEWAFSNCSSLTSITIPSSVTSIDNAAFSYCSSLTSIIVDSENTIYKSVDGILFNYAQTTLVCYPAGKTETSYTIQDGVISVGNYAFNGCSNINLVTIPSSVTSIGQYAFSDCNLTYVEIPDSVIDIDWAAFSYNYNLKTAVIGSGWVNSYYDDSDGPIFFGCDNLTDIYVGSVAISQIDLDIKDSDWETPMEFYSVTINSNGTVSYEMDGGNKKVYTALVADKHFVRREAVDEDEGANVHVVTLNSDTALASSTNNLLWTKKGNSGDDAKTAYKVVVDGGYYGPLPQGANGEPISWKNGNSRIKSTTPVGLSGDITLVGTYSTFPNTGVGVDIILPSAIILGLTVAIIFVATNGKKKKIIVKK